MLPTNSCMSKKARMSEMVRFIIVAVWCVCLFLIVAVMLLAKGIVAVDECIV